MSDILCQPPEAALTITRAAPRGMIQLRGDLSDKALRKAASGAGGVAIPDTRGIAFDGDRGLAWMAPDELLIFTPRDALGATLAGLRQALNGVPHLLADVSDARALFHLSGPGWREVLAKGTPADLHPKAFGPGTIRRTHLAQVAAAFWAEPDGAALVCARSVAGHVADWLVMASRAGTLPGVIRG